ncbi:MAG TPA: hypothetical protein PLX73_00975 [Candidatus Paceibacterota bacterium]|nr:hypothetical protein [Candidatus Paceibacterota bacterium]HOL53804.1 hypothetical protein [Candidatus Paceibacterota bacterium]HPP16945.1 hypothetical protein [Candidatus Paceibacterota bacterium]HRU33441.1 hypothetical protein [Candidatus Paceibacterota bacterium]
MFRKKLKERKRETEEKDRCVVCAKQTPYTKKVHINLRRYYVEGAGQLCQRCYERIYGTEDDQ